MKTLIVKNSKNKEIFKFTAKNKQDWTAIMDSFISEHDEINIKKIEHTSKTVTITLHDQKRIAA